METNTLLTREYILKGIWELATGINFCFNYLTILLESTDIVYRKDKMTSKFSILFIVLVGLAWSGSQLTIVALVVASL
jgi:hypothetical protein